MKHRPLSITLISYLYIAAGTIGIIYHAPELKEIAAVAEVSLALIIRALAIVGGIFTLRGANWARWLLVAWIVYHVILSFSHETSQLIMHIVVTLITAVALFHPKANAYFRGK